MRMLVVAGAVIFGLETASTRLGAEGRIME
jgi:hypothetical protein